MDESLVFGSVLEESTVENSDAAVENSTDAAAKDSTDAAAKNSTDAAVKNSTDAALQEGDAYAESDDCSSVFVGNSLYVFFRYYEVLASPCA